MAGYVQKTLASDESIIYDARFNWTHSLAPTLWFLIGALPAAFFAWLQFIFKAPPEGLIVGWWCAGAALVIGLGMFLGHWIYINTTEIVVTTFRLVFKTGWIARNTQEVSLNKIEEITLHQSVLGRIFGYGLLVIRGTGVGVIQLPNLDNPIEVRKIIENARAALRQGSESYRRSGEED
jgi:hypothetical protein